jgi:hypothetical protein
MNFRPADEPGGGKLENAMLSISQAVGAKDTKQPVVVPMTLNIDGRRIAEAISAALSEIMEHPNQSPYHDSMGGYSPPDQQFSST